MSKQPFDTVTMKQKIKQNVYLYTDVNPKRPLDVSTVASWQTSNYNDTPKRPPPWVGKMSISI